MRFFVCMMLRSKKPNLLQNNNYKIYKACEPNFLKFSRLSLGNLAKITIIKTTKKQNKHVLQNQRKLIL